MPPKILSDDQLKKHDIDTLKRFIRHKLGGYANTVEGYFAIFKRGIIGTYHHVPPQHLKRYLGEFNFGYNERSALGVDDSARAKKALQGIVGKRLICQRTNEAPNA